MRKESSLHSISRQHYQRATVTKISIRYRETLIEGILLSFLHIADISPIGMMLPQFAYLGIVGVGTYRYRGIHKQYGRYSTIWACSGGGNEIRHKRGKGGRVRY